MHQTPNWIDPFWDENKSSEEKKSTDEQHAMPLPWCWDILKDSSFER